MPSISDLLTDALRELGVLNAVDPPSGEDATLALFRFNKLLDNKNAERNGVYAQAFTSFALTPSLNPHTIGPTGTWVTTQRPMSIESADLLIGTTYTPIWIRDKDWYRARSVPSLAGAVVTDVYFEEGWPNGRLYFYPVPSAASTVRLGMRVILAAVALNDDFSLPPGYQDLLTLELAEDLAAPFRVGLSRETQTNLEHARSRVYGANRKVPRLTTVDAGMPCAAPGAEWDYRTGQ